MRKYILYSLILIFSLCYAQAKDPFALPQTAYAIVPIHYANPQAIASNLNNRKYGLLSIKGRTFVLGHTHQLWITDHPKNIKKIEQLIQALDQAPRQILIRTRIVLLDRQSLQQLGIYLSPAGTGDNTLTIPLLKINNIELLDLKLSALETQGHAVIISSPELLTRDGTSASIESGAELPYQEKTSQGDTSTAFKKAVLLLKVTPVILPKKTILLNLTVHQDKPSELLVNGMPAISTQQLNTQVAIKDQQTLVLGGIREQSFNQQKNSLPLLSRLPILGRLFQHQALAHRQKCLLIFITPKIFTLTS